jgi:serine-aspartate repeat-containing protein C/D/E
LNQANQIKDSFRLLHTDRVTSVNSESSDDGDRDIVVEEEKTVFEIDNTIKNTVTGRETDSDKDTDSDADTDTGSDKDTDVDCDQRQDFVEVLGMCKDSEKVDEEIETEESSDDGKNNNDDGNKHGNDNGNKHGNDNGNKHGK